MDYEKISEHTSIKFFDESPIMAEALRHEVLELLKQAHEAGRREQIEIDARLIEEDGLYRSCCCSRLAEAIRNRRSDK